MSSKSAHEVTMKMHELYDRTANDARKFKREDVATLQEARYLLVTMSLYLHGKSVVPLKECKKVS